MRIICFIFISVIYFLFIFFSVSLAKQDFEFGVTLLKDFTCFYLIALALTLGNEK